MREIIKVLFSFWLYPTISFILFIVLLINEFTRITLSLILWLCYGNNVRLVNDGADAVWEYRTPGNTRMVLVCFVTKRGQLDHVAGCAKTMEERLFNGGKGKTDNSYQKLQNVITRKLGYTCWKYDQNFRVRRHIRTLDRDFEYTEKDVMKMLSELTNDMDESKPQWEWVILPKYIDSKGEKKSLQVFRFHHAFMDGMSGLMLVAKLSENFKYSLDPLRFNTPIWKKIYFYVNCLLFAPVTLIQMYHNKYQTYWNRRRLRQRQLGNRGKKFLSWISNTIDLDVLKRIRFDTKASISSIVSFAFVEACKNVLPKKRLVKEMRVSEVIAFFPYPNSKPQNRFTAFTYPIQLEDKGESLFQRLRTTQKNSLGGISGPEPLIIYYVAKIAGRFPYYILPYIFSGANSSVHLSNVPSAKEPFQYFNAECEEFMAFPPLPNDTGLCVSSLSYKGRLKICGQADSSCLSENELRQIFHEIPKVIQSIADCSMPIQDMFPGSNLSQNDFSRHMSDPESSTSSGGGVRKNKNHISPDSRHFTHKHGSSNNVSNSKPPAPRRRHKKRSSAAKTV